MSHSYTPSYQHMSVEQQPAHKWIQTQKRKSHISDPALAASMTKAASSQTYLTIRYLVDQALVADAYRAYAYFRWVDDILDQDQQTEADRLAFLARQQEIIARSGRGEWPVGLSSEEKFVVDLIRSDQTENSGLRMYIEQMMAVMAFDANRKGRFISQEELDAYTLSLATAVTEALHYFIGHDDGSPRDETRYLAVTAAHITHMLRDALEDAAVGYYNIPQDYLEAQGIGPAEVNHAAYQAWVQSQAQLARDYFAIGRKYLARVENLRCRLAGYAYIARFEVVLESIEKDSYHLRLAYPERKSKKAGLKMVFAALKQTLASSIRNKRWISDLDITPTIATELSR